MAKIIGEIVKNLEHNLEKLKFVQKHFPDAKMTMPYRRNNVSLSVLDSNFTPTFNSKTINSDYEKFSFKRLYNTLYVVPYSELVFSHDGKEETIIVHSSPAQSRLAYIGYAPYHSPPGTKRPIKFSRVAINFKNNNFKEDMMNSCRAEIMSFIKDNPNCTLDQKHLEPRLKKLLLFT